MPCSTHSPSEQAGQLQLWPGLPLWARCVTSSGRNRKFALPVLGHRHWLACSLAGWLAAVRLRVVLSPLPLSACPCPRPCPCSKRLKESVVRFYASEVLLALQYLHLQGFVYR